MSPLFARKLRCISRAVWFCGLAVSVGSITEYCRLGSLGGLPSNIVDKPRSISFQQKEGEVPFKVTTALSSEVPEELLEFFGKYVSWTAI